MSYEEYMSLAPADQILLTSEKSDKRLAAIEERQAKLEAGLGERLSKIAGDLTLHVEECDKRFDKMEQEFNKRMDSFDLRLADSSVPEDFLQELDKFERTVALEPVVTRDRESNIDAYNRVLTDIGVDPAQIAKMRIIRTFRTNNRDHQERMYAEFGSAVSVTIILRHIGPANRQEVSLGRYLAYRPIYDLYKPLDDLAYSLRSHGREEGNDNIYTLIKVVNNTLRLELGMEGLSGRYLVPVEVADPTNAIKFIAMKGKQEKDEKDRKNNKRTRVSLSTSHQSENSELSDFRTSRTSLSVLNSPPLTLDRQDSEISDSRPPIPTLLSSSVFDESMSDINTFSPVPTANSRHDLTSASSRRLTSQTRMDNFVERSPKFKFPVVNTLATGSAQSSILSSKTKNSSNIDPVQQPFVLNQDKTLGKLFDSTKVDGDWEIQRADVRGGRSHSLTINFKPCLYRQVVCGILREMAQEGWTIDDGMGGRYRAHNVTLKSDAAGSVYQACLKVCNEKIINTVTLTECQATFTLHFTKSSVQIQGKDSEKLWDEFLKGLISSEAAEKGVALDQMDKSLQIMLGGAKKKTFQTQRQKPLHHGICAVCENSDDKVTRRCRNCLKKVHSNCVREGTCLTCKGLATPPPPSNPSPALAGGRLKILRRTTGPGAPGGVAEAANPSRPPAAQSAPTVASVPDTQPPGGVTMDESMPCALTRLDGTPVISQPKLTVTRPPAAPEALSGATLESAPTTVTSRTAPPLPPAAQTQPAGRGGSPAGRAVVQSWAPMISQPELTVTRPPAAPEALSGVTLESAPTTVTGRTAPPLPPAAQTQPAGRGGSPAGRAVVQSWAPPVSPTRPGSSRPLAVQTLLTGQQTPLVGRSMTPGRGRRGIPAPGMIHQQETTPGDTPLRQPRRTTFNPNVALRDAAIEDLQVKVALLKEDKERLEQLNDEMRRARVLNDLPQRSGLSGEAPTILNTNTVSVGCCSNKGRCEERSRTQVIRGTTVVGDTADGGPQDEGSVIIEDVPDDAEAGPEVTGAHRSSPEPTQ